MTTPVKVNKPRTPRYKLEGVLFLAVVALVVALAYLQFRGDLTPKTPLTILASRAGLVMDPGSKVTYNGVQIGRVASVSEVERGGKPAAKLALDVDPQYIKLIPANVAVNITATTVFGNKYVSFTSPKDPTLQRITPDRVVDASSVTTEFNTLFETLTSIAEKVDPVKLNLTLSAAAEALTGLGDKFGAALVNGNAILDDVNPQMPQLRHDIQRLADLGDTYANASPDLWDFLNHAVTTAHTITQRQGDLDAALLAAAGFGNTGAEIFERGGPYLVRGAADLVPSAQLLNKYSPELFCTIRNYHDEAPKIAKVLGGNGVGGDAIVEVLGGANPYVYPDNLPRVNASGGPGGAPGCWQPITHALWPAPYLVMDTGASLAPYNHFEIGSPYVNEYVWGRQVGENTINP
jgi:phospholipid/cholesterol/gamma-HCH transport system substrate-binding protein